MYLPNDNGESTTVTTCICWLRVVNLTAVEQDAAMGTDAVAQLIPAGAVSQTPDMDTGANQCSYGETDRKAKRGGQWVATVADYPQPSLYVRWPAVSVLGH